jgi:hypothetical protein
VALLAPGQRLPGRGPLGAAGYQPGSGSLGGGVILLSHAGGDAPADRDALVFGPGPDIRSALAAGCGPPGPAALPPPGPAGVGDERRELRAERGGVAGAQVDLVAGAAEPEPDRLIGRAAVEVVFQRDGYLLCQPGLPASGIGYLTVQDRPMLQ